MFWGLIIESNKKYTQVIDKSFHLSMASLDANQSSDELVQLNVLYENSSYLLCSLKKDSVYQVPLDLNFQAGTKISFSCNGNGRVYLTGYLVVDEDEDIFDIEENEDDEEIPRLVPVEKKRKANEQKDIFSNKAKKSKSEVSEDDNDEDEDDSSDSDNLNLGNDSDSQEDENEEDDDDDDEDEEDDDDDDDDSDEDDGEEEVIEMQEKLSKKQKQNQNQSQQQNKKEKNKLMNGSDTKVEQQGKKKKNKENNESNKSETKLEQQQPKKRVVEGNVQVEDIKEGKGAVAKSGKFITVYYVGRLKSGKVFDQTTKGEGFKFRLGKGEVIKGWDIGIAGMKVGGKRRIVIPPQMGYGSKGSPPVIPPNSQLIFEVDLKGVH